MYYLLCKIKEIFICNCDKQQLRLFFFGTVYIIVPQNKLNMEFVQNGLCGGVYGGVCDKNVNLFLLTELCSCLLVKLGTRNM